MVNSEGCAVRTELSYTIMIGVLVGWLLYWQGTVWYHVQRYTGSGQNNGKTKKLRNRICLC
jgi:hypothetical protein